MSSVHNIDANEIRTHARINQKNVFLNHVDCRTDADVARNFDWGVQWDREPKWKNVTFFSLFGMDQYLSYRTERSCLQSFVRLGHHEG